MKYNIEHDFDFPAKFVLEKMFSEKIIEKLKPMMTTIIDAETLEREKKGDIIKRRVRYMPVPIIKSVGVKKVEPKWMEWIEESEADLKNLMVSYKNIPVIEEIAEKLKNSGTMIFEDRGKGCRRTIKGELKVDVFILGVIAERVIFVYAKKILDDEAKALTEYMKKSH